MEVFKVAHCNVGKDNAIWIFVLAICCPLHIILAALIARKSRGDLTPFIKWTAICTITYPIFGIGWIVSLAVGI